MLSIAISTILGAAVMRFFLFLIFHWKPLISRLSRSFNGVVGKRIDHFFNEVKKQIPMAGAFIQGELETNLKKQALDEVGQSLAEIESYICWPLTVVGAVIGMITAFVI